MSLRSKNKRKSTISVVIATFNEEKNIGRCLEEVKDWVDEIIVVDGESTDRTVAIAKKYGAKVFVTTNKPIFHINKQIGIDKAKGEWILQLDADEIVTSSLRDEILEITRKKKGKDDEIVAYYLPRKNYFLGRWLKKGGQYPDYIIRFFKHGQAYLPCISVHEQMKVKGKTDYLKGHLLHYPFPTFAEYLVKLNRYTSLRAREHLHSHLSLNLSSAIKYLIIVPLKKFFILYLLFKGFLDGFPGFVFSLFSGLQEAIAYFKYWQIKNEEKINPS